MPLHGAHVRQLGHARPGVAAGWHDLMDSLASHVNGTPKVHSYEELTEFSVGYLRDLYRWNAMVQCISDN